MVTIMYSPVLHVTCTCTHIWFYKYMYTVRGIFKTYSYQISQQVQFALTTISLEIRITVPVTKIYK